MITQYAQIRKETLEEDIKLLTEAWKLPQKKVFLITVKDPKKNTLNIVVTEEDKIFEIKIQMDQVNVPNQINLHKQTTEVIYSNLLHSYLNVKKLKSKLEKLEE